MISMLVDKLNLLYLVEPNTFVRRLNVKLKQDWNNEMGRKAIYCQP